MEPNTPLPDKAAIKLSFNSEEEFFSELDRDKALIERSIVRVTREYRYHRYGPEVHAYIVATAVVAGRLVTYRKFMGTSLMLRGDQDEVFVRSAERSKSLAARIRDAGLEVRHGLLEPAGEE